VDGVDLLLDPYVPEHVSQPPVVAYWHSGGLTVTARGDTGAHGLAYVPAPS